MIEDITSSSKNMQPPEIKKTQVPESEDNPTPVEAQGKLLLFPEERKKAKTSQECRRYEDCGAPLCPLNFAELEQEVWYPDEEICTARKFARMSWVRKQKLIARKYSSADRYFTVQMLETIARVTKGIEGANPDSPDGEESWFEHRNSKQGG
jgi:hypothetical protein